MAARVIGYGAIAFAAIWMFNIHTRQSRAVEAELRERDAEFARRAELAKTDPDAVKRLQDAEHHERWRQATASKSCEACGRAYEF